MKLLEIIARIVEQEFCHLVVPQRKREAAGAAVLIGEIEAVVVVAAIVSAVHVIQAIVVELPVDREAAGVIVDHVEHDRDAVDMAEVDQRLELSGSGLDIGKRDGGLLPGRVERVEFCHIVRQILNRDIGEVGREQIRAAIAHVRIGFLLVDRKRLQDIDAEIGEVGNFQGDVEEVRADAGSCDRKGADMELVDDHVGKIRRHEIPVVPGKAAGAQDGKAVRKVLRLEFARAGVALGAARACALDPETIAVAIFSACLVSGPVAPRILLQQAVVGELFENLSAKNAVQIDRGGLRRPDPKGCAIRSQRRAGSAFAGKYAPGKARPALVTTSRQLRRTISIAFR